MWNEVFIIDSGIGEFEIYLEMLGIILGGVRIWFGLKLFEKIWKERFKV